MSSSRAWGPLVGLGQQWTQELGSAFKTTSTHTFFLFSQFHLFTYFRLYRLHFHEGFSLVVVHGLLITVLILWSLGSRAPVSAVVAPGP